MSTTPPLDQVAQPALLRPVSDGAHIGGHVPPLSAEDACYTPLRHAQALVGALPIRPGDHVLEPYVGGGAWLEAVRRVHPRTERYALDIDPHAPALQWEPPLVHWSRCGDFLNWRPPSWTAQPHWIVTNPPYQNVLEHIEHSLGAVRRNGSVAMLLGIGVTAGQLRWQRIYSKCRPRLVVQIPERIPFGGRSRDGLVLTGKGTAGRDNVFVWWDLGYRGPTFTAWLNPETMVVEV